MKSGILVICSFFFLHLSLAQDPVEPIQQSKKNEVSIEVKSLIEQFFYKEKIFDPNDIYRIEPTPYFVLYRRFFGPWSLRAGIAAGEYNYEASDSTGVGQGGSKRLTTQLGFEHRSDFGKHWQVFYGLDLFYSSFNTYHYYKSSTTNSFNDTETKSHSYGFAPTFGIRFKLNERISITTESCYQFYKADRKDIGTTNNNQVNNDYPNSYISFIPPTSLFFTFNF